MKLGFVSSIFDGHSFEEVIDFASEEGFDAVEIACWPVGKAERRYAGVTHINVDTLDNEKVAYIKKYCADRNVEISALAYYPNNMEKDLEKRDFYNSHLLKVINAAAKLDINMVTTFIGRVTDMVASKNLDLVKEVWDPIIKHATSKGVKIGIENCPMLFTEDEWPGGQNIATTPFHLRRIFKDLDSDMIGLNYDPSHLILQGMDYNKPLYEFKDKLFHIHFKDIKVYKDKIDEYGYFATPSLYSEPKIPGLGDIDWGSYVSALRDNGFKGYACIEVEDRSFEDSFEDVKESLRLSKRYLNQFIM